MDYEIIRSKRKSVCIEIKPDGRVLVRVPNRTTQAQIDDLLLEKKDWIEKHLAKIFAKSKDYVEVEKLSKEDISRLTKKARQYIGARCEVYARIIGVDYNRIAIRRQQTRWGSCSSKGNLNFNMLLMLAPIEVIDYVVIHELCHRKQMNHSRQFWALVESAMPDYKVHRQWLKDNGARLMKMLPDEESGSVFFTYILECADGSYYTGYTNDLDKRLKDHNDGNGARYTRVRLPVRLVYYEEYTTKEEAMRREALIKQLTRKEKECLIKKKG